MKQLFEQHTDVMTASVGAIVALFMIAVLARIWP
jgi:hypothetical protein